MDIYLEDILNGDIDKINRLPGINFLNRLLHEYDDEPYFDFDTRNINNYNLFCFIPFNENKVEYYIKGMTIKSINPDHEIFYKVFKENNNIFILDYDDRTLTNSDKLFRKYYHMYNGSINNNEYT